MCCSYKVDHVSENELRFVLKSIKDTFKSDLLRLDHTLNVHLVLLNSENKIQIYNGTTDIMNAFYGKIESSATKEDMAYRQYKPFPFSFLHHQLTTVHLQAVIIIIVSKAVWKRLMKPIHTL